MLSCSAAENSQAHVSQMVLRLLRPFCHRSEPRARTHFLTISENNSRNFHPLGSFSASFSLVCDSFLRYSIRVMAMAFSPTFVPSFTDHSTAHLVTPPPTRPTPKPGDLSPKKRKYGQVAPAQLFSKRDDPQTDCDGQHISKSSMNISLVPQKAHLASSVLPDWDVLHWKQHVRRLLYRVSVSLSPEATCAHTSPDPAVHRGRLASITFPPPPL